MPRPRGGSPRFPVNLLSLNGQADCFFLISIVWLGSTRSQTTASPSSRLLLHGLTVATTSSPVQRTSTVTSRSCPAAGRGGEGQDQVAKPSRPQATIRRARIGKLHEGFPRLAPIPAPRNPAVSGGRPQPAEHSRRGKRVDEAI